MPQCHSRMKAAKLCRDSEPLHHSPLSKAATARGSLLPVAVPKTSRVHAICHSPLLSAVVPSHRLSARCDQRILAIMTLLLSGRRQVPSDVSVHNQRRINIATGQVNERRMIGYLEKSWVMGVKGLLAQDSGPRPRPRPRCNPDA